MRKIFVERRVSGYRGTVYFLSGRTFNLIKPRLATIFQHPNGLWCLSFGLFGRQTRFYSARNAELSLYYALEATGYEVVVE